MTRVEVCVILSDGSGTIIDLKMFLTLAQAIKFITKHRSSTFGCYEYFLHLFDVPPEDVD